MMCGNFGSAAAAFLLIPVIIGAVCVGVVLGVSIVWLLAWVVSLAA